MDRVVSGLTQPLPSLLQFSTQTASFSQSLFPRVWRAHCLATQYNDYAVIQVDNLPRLRAKELIILSTGTTQVAQKWPPKNFWTSKIPFSTSLYSAALWHIVGLPGLPRWDGHPCLSSLGSLDLLYMLAQKPQLPLRGFFRNKLERSTQGEPSLWGAELAGVPGSKPPQTLRPKLTSPRMGAKNLKPCAGNGNRGAFPKKGPRWPSSLSLEQGTKGFCVGHCWSGCVRLWGTRNFSRVWAQPEGTGYRAPSAEA